MKIVAYIQEAYKELIHKVTWPSWSELQTSSIVVMIASLIFALIVFVMDISFDKIMSIIYKMLGGY
ncbi:MAG: preprotein translocase subunit SecE [Bacteroidales bacterium]|nr:preprotein translocase subunit SecE [Bacteroidales bacterium]